MQTITEWHDVDAAKFNDEIVARNQPAVLRGLIKTWPAVAMAQQSVPALCEYIKSSETGKTAELFLGHPSIRGRFWYSADMQGFNFERKVVTIAAALDTMLAHLQDAEPPAIYLGAAPVQACLPQFGAQNVNPILNASIQPRIWFGNAITVPAHFDISENLACVVAGKRRFTLFPPEQLANMYVGPLDFTMAGQPVSMVRLHDPDYQKYPHFKEALATASYAELQPGDAIYIPYMWWHHIESLAPFNVLVNYWWNSGLAEAGSPFEGLAHAILSVRSLEPEKRAIWQRFFEHYVFEVNGDPVAHLAENDKGILNKMSPQLAGHIKAWLLRALTRK
jgi:hypothetical protein